MIDNTHTAAQEHHNSLHPLERQQLITYASDKRKNHYVWGRLCAKCSLTQCANRMAPLDHICITNGAFGQPVVLHNPDSPAMGVSIAHSHHIVAAVAFAQSHPMAVDVEVVDPMHTHTLWSQLTPHERQLLQTTNQPNAVGCTLLWSAWESLAKGLQAGVSTTHEPYEVQQLQVRDGLIEISFRHFSHVVAVCFLLNSNALAQHPLLTRHVQDSDKRRNRLSNKHQLPCWLSVLIPKLGRTSHFVSGFYAACQHAQELFSASATDSPTLAAAQSHR